MDLPRVASWLESVFSGPDGRCARLVLSWTLAGGIAGGGLLIGALDLAGVGNPGLHLLIAPVLFLLGTAGGCVHAMVLGVAGRPAGTCRGTAVRRGLVALGVAAPLLGLSWIVSSAIAVGVAIDGTSGFGVVGVAAVGWLIGVGVCVWAACEGCRATRGAFRRCPHGKVGAALSLFGLGATSAFFAEFGTEVPMVGRDLTWRQSVAFAIAFTVWLWVPVVYLTLHRLGETRLRPPA